MCHETMNQSFSLVARWMAVHLGHAYAFIAAVVIVLIWLVTGPYFDYSDTWQLIINTGTTVVTFLMVFLLQHSQNRDTLAIQLKLDELIAASTNASNWMMRIEQMTEEDLIKLRERKVAPGPRRPRR